MDGKAGTWILYAILAVIAFFVIKWVLTAVLHMLFTVLQFAIIAAVVIAIVYALYAIFGRKRQAY